MPLLRVQPDDLDQSQPLPASWKPRGLVDDRTPIRRSCRAGVGDPYGWDLQPDEHFLYLPEGARSPVATLAIDLPTRDNRQLFWLRLVVHPGHRRRGHGSAVMAEVLRMAEQAGRSILWVEAVEDDSGPGSSASGSVSATPATMPGGGNGWPTSTSDGAPAVGRGRDRRGRLPAGAVASPVPEPTLQEMIEVTAAINDAPMGQLTFEDEVFDLQRMRDVEAAREGRGDQSYRMIARHRETGEIGGHTNVVISPHRRELGFQADTAVARSHRGHRLGLLVKIDMMHWLAEAEPSSR